MSHFWLPAKLDAAPNLKFIQFASAGVNHMAKSPFYTDTKIPILTANGVHGPQIAEWVVMMNLVHEHKYVTLYEHQKRHEWTLKGGRLFQDRVGKRVGILGYGSIGRQGKSIISFEIMLSAASPRLSCPSNVFCGTEGQSVWGRGLSALLLLWSACSLPVPKFAHYTTYNTPTWDTLGRVTQRQHFRNIPTMLLHDAQRFRLRYLIAPRS
jgi:hypothetical protein